MKKLLLATGNERANLRLRKDITEYDVVEEEVSFKSDLKEACQRLNPDVVLVNESLAGKEILIQELIDIKQVQKNIRFIYLAGKIDLKDEEEVNKLATLVMVGIYDIYHEERLNYLMLRDIINKEKKKDEVEYLLKYLKKHETVDNKKSVIIEGLEEEEARDKEEDGYKNVYVVSSIKPGTGKSFVAVNIATAIAKYGAKKPDGTRPKVAIIEGDLQNLSVGTLLQIEDDDKNIKNAMEKISTILTSDGNNINKNVTKEKIAEVDKQVLGSFIPYYNVKNLEALVGSKFNITEFEKITESHYSYIIDLVSEVYDVVIIDSNSSLEHINTISLLRSSNTAYYILNLDFNNVVNNKRYKSNLKDLGVLPKIKYVLNESLEDDGYEKLIFDAEHLNDSFKVEAEVPIIPKSIFLNRLYQGTPIVLDNTEHTLKARLELSKVANQIWEIDNLESLDNAYTKYINAKNKKKKGFFGRGL